MVELASAISRKAELITSIALEEDRPPTILLAYLVYLMSKYGLKLLSPSGERVVTPLGKVSAEDGSCLYMATDLKLRSLDLLHVAHLLSLKNRGYSIETLLTSDTEFFKAAKFLGQRGVRVVIQKGSRATEAK